MHQECASVPRFEGRPSQVYIVNFNPVLNIFGNTLEKIFFRLRMIKGRVDEVYTQCAKGFLLEKIRGILQVDMQQNVVVLASRLTLKAQTDPTVSFVRSGVVTCGNGVHKTEKAGLRSASFVQLVEQLSPFAIQHGIEALSGYIARAGTVEIIANLLVVGRDGFGNGSGGSSDDQKPARDFLTGADFGERTKDRRIQIEGKRLVMSVELFSDRHRNSPVE